jgi:hypothetical protein
MVSKEHIDALVATAIDGPVDEPGPAFSRWHDSMRWNCERIIPGVLDAYDYEETEHLLGEMFIKENLSSIHCRYPDTLQDPENTPGPCEQYWLQEYRLPRGTARLTCVQALKALDGYEYQSCEHPEWEASAARQFCNAFRSNLISSLPGYDAAAWSIEPAETE